MERTWKKKEMEEKVKIKIKWNAKEREGKK